jgi:hypothetical protein
MSYGCKNGPRPSNNSSYLAQDGWFIDESGMTRKPKMVRVKTEFDYACQHDRSISDPQCDGCQWRKA